MYESKHFLSSYGWIVVQTGIFNLGMAAGQEKKNWIQTNCRLGEGWAPPYYSCPRHTPTTKPDGGTSEW